MLTVKELKDLEAKHEGPNAPGPDFWDTEDGRKFILYHSIATFKLTSKKEVAQASKMITPEGEQPTYDVYEKKMMEQVLELHRIMEYVSEEVFGED